MPRIAALFAALAISLPAHAGELTVSAAASLADAMREIAARFEAGQPGVRVRVNAGGSGALLQQIAHGAPVDLFVSADEATMDEAARRGLIDGKSRFDLAGNRLVLVAPGSSTLKVDSLAALSQPAVRRVALGNPDSVPAGRYAQAALLSAGLWPALNAKAVRAQNVRQALDYAARGEVDAAFVYASDAQAFSGKVKTLLTVKTATPVRYPAAVVSGSRNRQDAHRFASYLQGAAAQGVLAAHGFTRP
ncbi:molybdate ABC transporter substrate-binding protein [Crenobacter caeni]|uniref:Molybdate ABC transporter substrate-binding protein n=1 Tax=Crenobacter caeni TaxID=2705474 RepID=A0A6B2KR88_9NEIS|nr:molybdate ABC transporter substrate-binding protein [Crenobacter caeni]NDV12593.1 molybdate ABC transporter substrate-binding protein [Crenobacter caeni]